MITEFSVADSVGFEANSKFNPMIFLDSYWFTTPASQTPYSVSFGDLQ